MRYFQPEKIKERRKVLKMTQDDLAQKVGISRVHISNLEKGKNNPSAVILGKIAFVLGVREDYFFEEERRRSEYGHQD